MCRCSKSIVLKGCQANRPVSTRKRLILYLEWVYTVSMLFCERAGMWTGVSFMVQGNVKPWSYELACTAESLNSALGPPTDVSPQESKSKWDVWDAYLYFYPPVFCWILVLVCQNRCEYLGMQICYEHFCLFQNMHVLKWRGVC